MLAGLARDTSRIRLGVLVAPVTFRLPGNLAKVAMSIQEMSGGRLELGLGAGWNDDEHRQYGFPFPPIEVRAEMLEEQLEIVSGLWDQPAGWVVPRQALHDRRVPVRATTRPTSAGDRGSSSVARGRRGRCAWRPDSPTSSTSPGPIPLGPWRSSLAWMMRVGASGGIPESIARSAMLGTMIAADERALEARVSALMERIGVAGSGTDAEEWLAARRPRWILGTFEEARESVRRYAQAGVQRIMLQDLFPWDLDMIREMGRELVGRV